MEWNDRGFGFNVKSINNNVSGILFDYIGAFLLLEVI